VIHWPERFDPKRCPIHVRNELAMTARPDNVWAWLVRAVRWPSWYPNSHNVRIEHSDRPDLAAGVHFRWRTNGVSLRSKVEEFVPCERLAWDARAWGVSAYHAWLIEPRPGGCWVLTEETQQGWLARLGALLMPNKMHRVHQMWLERLQAMALDGPP
jgi:hypothetical protein